MSQHESGVDRLIARVDEAVKLEGVENVTHRVKEELEDLIGRGLLRLPAAYRSARADTYARRLLHRDARLGYSAVVMTWGPGQRTPLHDHAGIWCVEGVIEGRMEVTQYDLVGADGDSFAFETRGTLNAGVGSAGCLIPPFEYHVLANAQSTEPSITLHVYGGEMDHCHVFEPLEDGRYRRVARSLSYHD
jgi:predicted metal-dependent enzyme (double-stranded beta helix superfamily)